MLIEPLLNEFESQTGIDVEWIYSKKGLVQKIILEKDKPVADVFLASDISRLIDVAEAGASIKINNSSAVPSHLQSDNWIGLTQRARIIYVNKDLGLNDITYEDLVSEKYKGRICTRSGFHPYNISLFASFLVFLTLTFAFSASDFATFTSSFLLSSVKFPQFLSSLLCFFSLLSSLLSFYIFFHLSLLSISGVSLVE